MRAILFGIFLINLNFNTGLAQDLTGREIIEKSQRYHDPNGNWGKSVFKAHIQEPRPSVPHRYSLVEMNIGENSFELSRNRGDRISTHIVKRDGSTQSKLDGKLITNTEILEQYRLTPDQNKSYKKTYYFRFGFPMSLTDEKIKTYGGVQQVIFNEKKAYKVEVELFESLFSTHWFLYFSQENFEILGADMIPPQDPSKGERLYYEGSYEFGGVTIPRITHWYDIQLNEYLGSDIIVKALEDK